MSKGSGFSEVAAAIEAAGVSLPVVEETQRMLVDATLRAVGRLTAKRSRAWWELDERSHVVQVRDITTVRNYDDATGTSSDVVGDVTVECYGVGEQNGTAHKYDAVLHVRFFFASGSLRVHLGGSMTEAARSEVARQAEAVLVAAGVDWVKLAEEAQRAQRQRKVLAELNDAANALERAGRFAAGCDFTPIAPFQGRVQS